MPESRRAIEKYDANDALRVSLYGKNAVGGDTELYLTPSGRVVAQLGIMVIPTDGRQNTAAAPPSTTDGEKGGWLVYPLRYNGQTWDLSRNNVALTLLPSATRTASTASANQTNYNASHLFVFLNVTAVPGTDTINLYVQGIDPVSGEAFNIVQTGALSSTGHYGVAVGPGSSTAGDEIVAAKDTPLPRVWRVYVVHSAATSFTYSVGAVMIL